MAEVVILGAGLAGLSVAYHLESYNYLDYKIFEQDTRPGGLLKTETVDGFSFDYTGHFLHISDQYFYNFLDTVADLKENFEIIQRSSLIFLSNTYLTYPIQKNLFGLPSNIIYDCVNGFINRKKNIRQPQSFYEWVLKYFGSGFGKHFFYPYNSKLLRCDVRKIVPSWTGRFVPQTDLKSILGGAIEHKKEQNIGYNNSFYYPKQGGIEFLIKKITALIKNKIETNHKVIAVDLQNKIVHFENGKTEKYEILISTIPLKYLLAHTQNTTATNYLKISEKLRCASVINFNLGLKRDKLGESHWTYFPETNFPFYRIGYWHNISQLSVAPHSTGIYGETSFINETKSPKQIQKLAEKSVNAALKYLDVSASDILINKTLNIDYAYVIYDSWREKKLKKLLNSLEDQSLYCAGRFGEWNYSSMQEAVLSGKFITDKISKRLGIASNKY